MFSAVLLRTRKDDMFLTDENFEHIKRCAVAAYPEEESHEYLEYANAAEFLASLSCGLGQLYVLTGPNWYCIVIRQLTHYVTYDFASATGKCIDIFKVYMTLIKLFRGKRCFFLCRESTSYPLLKALEKKGKFTIIKERSVVYENEPYHKVMIKVK
jgi:hypothetical protein